MRVPFTETPPQLIIGSPIGITAGQLDLGVTVPLSGNTIFMNWVRLYERYLFRPGEYEHNGGVVKLSSGLRVRMEFPYTEMQGKISGVITVDDENGGYVRADQINWDDVFSYQWSRTFDPKSNGWDIPREALEYVEGNQSYRSGNRVYPCNLHLKALGQISNVLGPDSTGAGYDTNRVVAYLYPEFGVEFIGRLPFDSLNGIGSFGSGAVVSSGQDYEDNIASLAANYDKAESYSIMQRMPVSLSYNATTSGATLVPLEISFPTMALVNSIKDSAWPSGLPTKAAMQNAFDLGQKTASFTIFMMIPSSGDIQRILQVTDDVLALLGESAHQKTLATFKEDGSISTRSFGSSGKVMHGVVDEGLAQTGDWIATEGYEMLIGVLEYASALLKTDEHSTYTLNTQGDFEKFLGKELAPALAYTIANYSDEFGDVVARVDEMYEEIKAGFAGEIGTRVVPAIIFNGNYPGTYESAKWHTTEEERAQILSELPAEMDVYFNVIKSPLDASYMCLAGSAHQIDVTTGAFKQTEERSAAKDVAPPFADMMESSVSNSIPVVIVTSGMESHVYYNGDPTDQQSALPILSRTDWPIRPGVRVDLSDAEYQTLDPSLYRIPMFRFEGSVVGKGVGTEFLGGSTFDYLALQEFAYTGATATITDARYGLFSDVFTSYLMPMCDLTAGGIAFDPTMWDGFLSGIAWDNAKSGTALSPFQSCWTFAPESLLQNPFGGSYSAVLVGTLTVDLFPSSFTLPGTTPVIAFKESAAKKGHKEETVMPTVRRPRRVPFKVSSRAVRDAKVRERKPDPSLRKQTYHSYISKPVAASSSGGVRRAPQKKSTSNHKPKANGARPKAHHKKSQVATKPNHQKPKGKGKGHAKGRARQH
jgi:hypothetical protein